MIDIHCCDNLELLQKLPDNHIDLIYCDILYGTGKNFGDYQDLRPIRSEIENHYIPRIKEMHRVLKETGSIYLQMDTRINHWMRCILDDVFGYKNFKNEIIWSYYSRAMPTKWFARKHNVIIFYTKDEDYVFNLDEIRVPYRPRSTAAYNKIDDKGRRYQLQSYGKRSYMSEKGCPCPDVWNMQLLGSRDSERTGYPTQKPKALLERIIRASSNEGDLVADFYMGSGTTAVVCKELNRNFIGCDISEKAIRVTRERLEVAQERINKELAEIDSRLF